MTSGSELFASIWTLEGVAREAKILDAGLSVPPWLLEWVPITVASPIKLEGGKSAIELTYEVARDGWAIGTAADWRRVPVTFRTAKSIAKANGWTFPTRAMVKQIERVADVRVWMPTFGVPREATSRYQDSHDGIEKQLAGNPAAHGLISGGKKDLVLSRLLDRRIAGVPSKQIYGGRWPDGSNIQGQSDPPAHDENYVDYSEQWRPVRRVVRLLSRAVDGTETITTPDLHDVIRSSALAPLVSDEVPASYDADSLLAGGGPGPTGPGGGGTGGVVVRATAAASSPAGVRVARGLLAAFGVTGLALGAMNASELAAWFSRLFRR